MGAVPLESFVGLLVGLVIGLAGVYVLARLRAQTARALAEQIVVNAHREAETTRRHAELAAKEESLKRREELDHELGAKKVSLHEQERRLEKRSDLLDQKLELLTNRESETAERLREIAAERERVVAQQGELKQKLAAQIEALERISRLSAMRRARSCFRGSKASWRLKWGAACSSTRRSCRKAASRNAGRS